MPTYEYLCDTCGYKFELFQGINDKPESKCPECGKKVRRLMGTGSGIIFKGSGFYATDYRKKSPKENSACPASKDGCANCPKAES